MGMYAGYYRISDAELEQLRQLLADPAAILAMAQHNAAYYQAWKRVIWIRCGTYCVLKCVIWIRCGTHCILC